MINPIYQILFFEIHLLLIIDVVFASSNPYRFQIRYVLFLNSLFSPVIPERFRMIVVSNVQYIMLCTKAYKGVILLHFCVNYDEKNEHDYLINQRKALSI